MAHPKEVVVVVLDVGQSMASTAHSPTRLNSALTALTLLVQRKVLFSPKDEVGVVLFGDAVTRNELHSSVGGYETVNVLFPIGSPSLDLLKSLSTVTGSSKEGDFLDAIVVACDMIRDRVDGKKTLGRVFLVTDASGLVAGVDQADEIVAQLTSISCKLDVVGVDFGTSTARARDKTQTKIDNEALLTRLTGSIGGHVMEVEQAVDIISTSNQRTYNQVSKFRGDLDIGGVVKIPVWTISKTAEARLPSLKKLSAPAANSGGDSCAVKMDRTYRSQRNVATLVPPDERAKGFRYGKQLVAFSEDDIAAMKFSTERCLLVLGFADVTLVPRFHFMSGVDVVVSAPGDDSAGMGLSALVHALNDTHRVAIARYVSRANSNPKLCALTPYIGSIHGLTAEERAADFECLLLNQLPFAEDLRPFDFKDLSTLTQQPTAVQLAAAEQLINALDLTKAPIDRAGNIGEIAKPETIYNPTLQRFYQALQARAMEPGCPLPPCPAAIEESIAPHPMLFAKAASAIRDFKTNFVLKRVEVVQKRKQRFWGDIVGSEDTKADASKKARNGASGNNGNASGAAAGGAMSVQDVFTSGLTDEVGSMNPVADFKAMMARRDADLAEKAITGMCRQIRRLVEDGGSTFYPKAIACLNALRAGCLANYDEDKFNEFMAQLKASYQPASSSAHGFWDEIVSNAISLITRDESSSVNVTGAEAQRFLANAAAPAPVAAPAPAPAAAADDDLFGDMD